MNDLSVAHRVALVVVGGVAAIGLFEALPSRQAQPVSHVFVAAGEDGLRVVDVSDPAAPVEVGAVADLTGTRAVVVQEGHAYLARGAAGMAIVDVTDPTAPQLVGSLAEDATDVAVFGDRAYLVSPTSFHVVDVADPTAPAVLGTLQLGATAVVADGYYAYLAGALGVVVVRVADASQPEQVGLFLGRPEDLAIRDRWLLLVGRLPIHGLSIADIRQPPQPAGLGGIALSGDMRAVAVADMTYVAATASGSEPGGLSAVDDSDPVMPSVIGSLPGDFVDVAGEGQRVFVARLDGGLEVVDASDPADLQLLGVFTASWKAQRIALAMPQPVLPTPTQPGTATATGLWTPTSTLTGTAMVATATSTPTGTRSPTASPTAPPTGTPTAVMPSPMPTAFPTRLPGRSWRHFSRANAPLASDDVRRVSTDADGTAWVRVYLGERRPDGVVAALAHGPWRLYADLRQAVMRQSQDVRRLGVLEGFWAFNERGDVWIGAEYFDGQSWRVEGADEWSPDGRVRLHQEVLVDRTGIARVPVETTVRCTGIAPCRIAGLRPYVAGRHLQGDLILDVDPTALRRGVPSVRLLANPAPAGAPSGGWAVGHRALYPLPQVSGVPFPVLLDVAMSPRYRTGGHATAACLRPDGRPVVFTWVERHSLDPASRRTVSTHVYENQFAGETWAAVIDLSNSPLFPNGVGDDWVAAAAYGPDGERWLASARGILAAQNPAGLWIDAFQAAEIGLPEGALVRDLAIGVDGTVWLATSAGLFAYGTVDPAGAVWYLYVPVAQRD